MKQKKYMDIENLRETEDEFRRSNCGGFEVGDIIHISEKVDGSNGMICYDPENDCLQAYSRRKTLNYNDTLGGFWNYAQSLDKLAFAAHPSWKVFGEWSMKNKIKYDARFKDKWLVYDIFDVELEQWLPQDEVKHFCADAGLEYIHVFYEGPFISWGHCRSFMNSPQYGECQEGIVVRNLSKLTDVESRLPSYLKLVNESFKESVRTRKIDPEELAEKSAALELAKSIVTKPRVEKQLFKARDDGLLPEKLAPEDIGSIARIMPKMVYEDCSKEEPEVVAACGQHFGKMCGSITMKIIREIVLGE